MNITMQISIADGERALHGELACVLVVKEDKCFGFSNTSFALLI